MDNEPTIDDAAYQRGVREAHEDITKDTCRLFLGTRSFWGRRITDIMRDGFGVEVVHSSDITWEEKWSFEHGYNSIIFAYLDATYGTGTWDRIWEENQAYRLEVYQKYWPGLDSTPPIAE
jgi:hypothetical protein